MSYLLAGARINSGNASTQKMYKLRGYSQKVTYILVHQSHAEFHTIVQFQSIFIQTVIAANVKNVI